jgi:hypothetical protein
MLTDSSILDSAAPAMAEATPQTSAGSKAEPAASASSGVAELFKTVSEAQLAIEAEAAQVLWARVKGYPHWPVGPLMPRRTVGAPAPPARRRAAAEAFGDREARRRRPARGRRERRGRLG